MRSANEIREQEQYIDCKCIYCGRSFPLTMLNIEGKIHHGEPWRCVDTKDCNRARKKL